MSGEYQGGGQRLPSQASCDLEGMAATAAAYSIDTTSSTDETTPMDSETSRGESPSPNAVYAPITVGICAMNKKVSVEEV